MGGAGAEGLGFLACGAEEALQVAAGRCGLQLQGLVGGGLQAGHGGNDKGACGLWAGIAFARRDHAAGGDYARLNGAAVGAVLGVVCGHGSDGVCGGLLLLAVVCCCWRF